MRFFLLGLFLVGAILSLAVSQGKSPIGTMELISTPTSGGEVTFHAHLYKKAQLVNSVVWCWQGGSYVWMQEEFLLNTGWSKGQWDGTITFGPLEGNGDLEGKGLETSQPAYCVGVVFQEAQSANQGRTSLTNSVEFTLLAEGV